MEKSFHFVNSSDRASRKSLRSHVMKGKNTGKTLARSSRPRNPSHDRPGSRASTLHCIPSPVTTGIHDPYLSFKFPVRITKNELDIMNQWFNHVIEKFYPVQLGLSVQDNKLSWLQILCSDEATCRCNLALMQAGNEIFLGKVGNTAREAYCLSRTLREVKNRIEKHDALSDSTIAIVLSLIMHEQVREEYAAALVHMNGLSRIIQLRGSIDRLNMNPMLLVKLCKTDVVSSLHGGGPTQFYRDNMAEAQKSLTVRGLSFQPPTNASLHLLDPANPLQSILHDAMSFARVLNSPSSTNQLDIATYQEIELSICYRLLAYCTLDDYETACTDTAAVYHIGLMIFISTVFLQYDKRRMINFPLVSQRARAILTQSADNVDPTLAFWLASMAGFWAFWDTDGQWVTSAIHQAALRLSLLSFDEALGHLAKFPWINALHDHEARLNWDTAFRARGYVLTKDNSPR